MKLRYSPTSPYVRKVCVMAHETGLEQRIERLAIDSLNKDDIVNSPNPLGKVPVLETDDGQWIYDSPVICEYLDSLHDGPKLLPEAGPARWEALSRQALADGMVDATVLIFIEGLRKPERQSLGWIAHNKAAVARAIAALEDQAKIGAGGLEGPVTIGHIAIAVALDFVLMGLPDEDWRGDHPELARWFAAFAARPSMQATILAESHKAA